VADVLVGRGVRRRAPTLFDLIEGPTTAVGSALGAMGSAAKGAAQATVGLPGDIESLVRMITGGEQTLPTTERVGQFVDQYIRAPYPQYEKLGEFTGLPTAGIVSRPFTQATNQAADALVRAITRNPQATAPGVLQETAMPFVSAATPKYFNQIPETTKEIDRITDFLSKRAENSGFNVRTGASNVSGSRYVTLEKRAPDNEIEKSIEIRVSNHGDRHPFTSADERISIDPVTGTTLQDVLGLLDDRGFKLRKTEKKEKKLTDVEIAKKYGMTPNEMEIFAEQYRKSKGLISDPAFAGLLEPQAVTKGFNVVQPGDKVSGLTVRKDVPNMSSISASLDNYEILSGIREVPRSAFDKEYLGSLSYDKLDKRTKDLAEQIKQSKEINPMIVGLDSKGAYIIEGGHRFDALMSQDTKSIPAVVVIDKSDPPADIRNLLD
jgi:hypothetical protein